MEPLETIELRPDRTIERYISKDGKIMFIYNNQGLYFDVFFSEEKMNDFFNNKVDRGDLFFDNEEDLDEYFMTLIEESQELN